MEKLLKYFNDAVILLILKKYFTLGNLEALVLAHYVGGGKKADFLAQSGRTKTNWLQGCQAKINIRISLWQRNGDWNFVITMAAWLIDIHKYRIVLDLQSFI